MAQFGISIIKSVVFRDSIQPFSNTYHYAGLGAVPGEAGALDLIDEVVAAEKTMHSTAVTFVQGRLWSSGGTKAQNQMVAEKTLTGTGSMSTSSGFDKERAYLIQWSAGKDVRGNPVYLRKWFHACGFFGAHSIGASVMDQTTGFSSADRTAIATKADALTRIGPIDEWGLVAESGRERDGGAPSAHKYLEHHQLGDAWR